MVLGRLNTNDWRQGDNRKCISPDVCVMCMRDSESHEHPFMYCLMARSSLVQVVWVGGETCIIPRRVEEFNMISHVGFGRSRDASLLWDCAVFILL